MVRSVTNEKFSISLYTYIFLLNFQEYCGRVLRIHPCDNKRKDQNRNQRGGIYFLSRSCNFLFKYYKYIIIYFTCLRFRSQQGIAGEHEQSR